MKKNWLKVLIVLVVVWAGWYAYQNRPLPEEQEKFVRILHPKAQRKFRIFVRTAEAKTGCKLQFTSSYRTFAHQAQLVQQLGNMAADVGVSPHNYGFAGDIVVIDKNGKRHGQAQSKAEWLATGVPQIGLDMGFTWGGNFINHPFDPVHFDLIEYYNLKTSDLYKKAIAQFGNDWSKIEGNKVII